MRHRVAEKIEAKRSRIREENKEVVRQSRFDESSSSGMETKPTGLNRPPGRLQV